MSWILLSNGKPFDVLRPDPAGITADVLALSLSRLPRFCGHSLGEHAYSVAQHSVIVSGLVPRALALYGLLHDAHEAFISDIPTPVKELLPPAAGIARGIDGAVYTWAGLKPPDEGEAELVRLADRAAFEAEVRDLMPPPPRAIDFERTPYRVEARITPWPPAVAARKFKARLIKLAPRLA